MRTFTRTLLAAFLLVSLPFAWAGDFKKGWNAYSSGDYETALAEWQPLAEAGDVEGSYGLGLMYGNGFGVDMNDELALKYYGVAANAGHADAQYNLAVMHQNGWGVPPSDEEANKWYRLAAEQGVTAAQMALGRYYSLDFLDSYDPVKAYKWFTLAAKLGEYEANEKREFLAGRMKAEQVLEADALVSAWLSDNETIYAGN